MAPLRHCTPTIAEAATAMVEVALATLLIEPCMALSYLQDGPAQHIATALRRKVEAVPMGRGTHQSPHSCRQGMHTELNLANEPILRRASLPKASVCSCSGSALSILALVVVSWMMFRLFRVENSRTEWIVRCAMRSDRPRKYQLVIFIAPAELHGEHRIDLREVRP